MRGLDIIKLTKTPLIYSVSRFNLGGLGALFEGAKPTKAPLWRRNCFGLGLQSTPMGKRPRGRPRTRWRDFISDLAWSCLGVERAELSEIAVDRDVFWVHLGLLPPQLLPKEKRARIWVNEWVCRPTLNFSIYEINFRLFAKCKCRIQIIKHIFTETCVFVKIKYQT